MGGGSPLPNLLVEANLPAAATAERRPANGHDRESNHRTVIHQTGLVTSSRRALGSIRILGYKLRWDSPSVFGPQGSKDIVKLGRTFPRCAAASDKHRFPG